MSEEDDEFISRNFQIVKSAKQRLKLSKRIPLKSEIKKREYITDARRTYSQLLLNAFNSCDLDKLKHVFETYCRPDLHAVNLYEGGKNPTGANSTELKTVPILLPYWQTLFHSAPDFMFESQFVTAYTDTISHTSVVRSRFRMTGTRVLDVKLAQKANADVIKKKLKHKDKYSTSENELMVQIHNQLAASFVPLPDAATGATGVAYPPTAKVERTLEDVGIAAVDHDDLFLDELIMLASNLPEKSCSLLSSATPSVTTTSTMPTSNFQPLTTQVSTDSANSDATAIVEHSPVTTTGNSYATEDAGADVNDKKRKPGAPNVSAEAKAAQREATKKAKIEAAKISSIFKSGESIVFNEDAQIYADKPLAETLSLRYKGTFTVYLDANNKIFRYECIYTAIDDASVGDGTSTMSAEDDNDGSAHSNNANEEEECEADEPPPELS